MAETLAGSIWLRITSAAMGESSRASLGSQSASEVNKTRPRSIPRFFPCSKEMLDESCVKPFAAFRILAQTGFNATLTVVRKNSVGALP